MSFGYTHENGTKMRSLAYEGRWCLAVVLLSKVTRLEDWNKKQETRKIRLALLEITYNQKNDSLEQKFPRKIQTE